jgi:hypothetical protein
MKDEGKNVKKYIRRASVELWRAKVPHSTIRSQLKMLTLIQPGEVKVDHANFDVKFRTKFQNIRLFFI